MCTLPCLNQHDSVVSAVFEIEGDIFVNINHSFHYNFINRLVFSYTFIFPSLILCATEI